MTTILSMDPGTSLSAWLVYRDGRPVEWAKCDNEGLLRLLRDGMFRFYKPDKLAIERFASFGMPIGQEVVDAIEWGGRFQEAFTRHHPAAFVRCVFRREVKLHLCGQARAKDGNIRQALIDRFGGKEKAIGRKATPGPLYGVSADVWSALAIAITAAETTCA